MKVLETLIILAFGVVVAISAATYAREVWASHNVVEQALTVK